jgi:TonB family protein
MKIVIRWSFVFFFLLAFHVQVSFSQEVKINNNFKIVGERKVPIFPKSLETRTVEYNPENPDHLFISYFSKDGIIETKAQFRFTRKVFELNKIGDYMINRELVVDGIQTNYRLDGSIEKEQLIKDDQQLHLTCFYPDGKKQSVSSGDEKTLNGEYRMWYPNGQLWFFGNYKNNLKDGEFQQFDEGGTIIHKGIYSEGTLKSGDAVVPDIVYKNPEIIAKFINGDEAFDEWLKSRSASISKLKSDSVEMDINLNLVINKAGKISKIAKVSTSNPKIVEAIGTVFSDFSGYIPATVENIPVDSELNLHLMLSKDGLKSFSEKPSDVYLNVDQMPVFPGGLKAMRVFLAMNVKYPKQAIQNKIHGKVYVNFVVDELGDVTNVKIIKGASWILEDEALRVIKLMPKWEPGRMEGKAVKVSYTVPINFNMVLTGTNRTYFDIKDISEF